MPSIPLEAEAAAGSFWTIDHWLRHCEGYRVWDASGPIGYVETVLMTDDEEPHSLMVRVGLPSGGLVTWPVEAIQSLDAVTERVFVPSTAELPRRGTGRSWGTDLRKDLKSEAKIIAMINSRSVIGRVPIVSLSHWGGMISNRHLKALVAARVATS